MFEFCSWTTNGSSRKLTGFSGSHGSLPRVRKQETWCLIPAKHRHLQSAGLLRNSWGEGWGDKGYFYMPYEYICHPQLAQDTTPPGDHDRGRERKTRTYSKLRPANSAAFAVSWGSSVQCRSASVQVLQSYPKKPSKRQVFSLHSLNSWFRGWHGRTRPTHGPENSADHEILIPSRWCLLHKNLMFRG